MGRSMVPRVPLLLALSEMNNEELRALAGRIKAVVATSELVAQNPAMAACAAELDARDATFAAAEQTVEDDWSKLHIDIATREVARAALVAMLRTYATYATNDARTPADVHGAGLTSRDMTTSTLPPEPPASIDVIVPAKGRGRIKVSVHETGTGRRQYVAQQSTDGETWTPLGIGHGKTRTLTGDSGAQIWVRFAMIRGEAQSGWCTPVHVTIP